MCSCITYRGSIVFAHDVLFWSCHPCFMNSLTLCCLSLFLAHLPLPHLSLITSIPRPSRPPWWGGLWSEWWSSLWQWLDISHLGEGSQGPAYTPSRYSNDHPLSPPPPLISAAPPSNHYRQLFYSNLLVYYIVCEKYKFAFSISPKGCVFVIYLRQYVLPSFAM